jgi:hypothetical protein
MSGPDSGGDGAVQWDASGSYDARQGDAGIDTDAGPVLGRQVFYYVSDSQTLVANADFTSAQVVAYVLEADGGVTAYQGAGSGDGTFTIPGIPSGAEYFIRFQPNPEYPQVPIVGYSRARAIDESVYRYGRPDVGVAGAGASEAGTTVSYDLTGVLPSVVQADLWSFGAHAATLIGLGSTSTVAYAGTTIEGVDPVLPGESLIDGTRGDVTWAIGFSRVDGGLNQVNGAQPLAASQFLTSQQFTMVLGGTTQLSGAMTTMPIMPDGGLPELQWDHGSFAAVAAQMSGSAVASESNLSVMASPSGDVAGYPTSLFGAGDLYEYAIYDSDTMRTETESVLLPFGDPFPSSWTRFVEADIDALDEWTLMTPDGGTLPVYSEQLLVCTYDLATALGGVVRPTLGPAATFMINGHTASQSQSGIGLQPVVSWSAPAVGTPTAYAIDVYDLEVSQDGTSVVGTAVGSLTTTPDILQVTMPSGFLQASHQYLVMLAVRQGSGPDMPNVLGVPSCYVHMTSGIVEP